MFVFRLAQPLFSLWAKQGPSLLHFSTSSRLLNSDAHRTDQRFVELKSIADTHATLLIDGKETAYDWIFLRDSCQCVQCVDSSTRQKLHCTTDIPWNISPQPAGLHIVDDDRLEIVWNQSLLNQTNTTAHRSVYPTAWLRTYASPENLARARYHDRPRVHWDRDTIDKVNLHVRCDEYLHSDQGLYAVLKLLNDYGLVFIDDVHGELAVEQLTQRIGEIRHSFYGKSWNVKSVEQAINVAYTSQALGLHMDLLYFEAPPGLQFLHSLINSVKGGESYYVDSFHAAETLRQHDPQAFHLLCSYPVTFHYRNAGRHYHFTRPTIALNKHSSNGCIDHINYSPPFQAPFEGDTSQPDFRQFIRALQHFRDLLENPSNQYQLVLRKDQCAIFHNRRVLHARRAYDASSGSRWLKGCYTDLDNFKDRLRIFQEKYDPLSDLRL